MNNKNEPFKNRHFYDHFFKEHDKAEKIQIIEDMSNKNRTKNSIQKSIEKSYIKTYINFW